MASIGDVAAELRAAIAMAEEAAEHAKAADDRIEASLSNLQAALYDSSNHLAQEGLSQWGQAREQLAEALALLASGNKTMSGYVASIAGGGSGGSSPSAPHATGASGGQPPVPPASTKPVAPNPEPRRRLEGFNPKRSHPKAIEAIRRVGYPRNAEGRTSARAFAYTADGDQLTAEPLKPYRKGEAPVRQELREPWASSEDMSTTWHVEGDAAALIREGSLKDAAFYLNVPLCGSRQADTELPDPKGCAENFRHILPRDTVAYVHVVREGRVPYRQKITGTGEGIKE
ncbi:hypothetical protein LO763_08995 [Glycomyces sp. A-F 0318]|uniref:DddA-like double-stranded DNA deaminase toxin n=1 Tax=Glycomyces amatae TaxID=2881355 RepID=UPI001E55F5F9|nr:DddA-like double-stranded DNA deaminase toxin [Glycomyces amatae]MCD0443757.1 hypothetical protein [Glycomyces amatae]